MVVTAITSPAGHRTPSVTPTFQGAWRLELDSLGPLHFRLSGGKTEKRGRNIENMIPGQIITTSAEVTPNGGLVGEFPQNDLNSGLGIIVICPDRKHDSLTAHCSLLRSWVLGLWVKRVPGNTF